MLSNLFYRNYGLNYLYFQNEFNITEPIKSWKLQSLNLALQKLLVFAGINCVSRLFNIPISNSKVQIKVIEIKPTGM